MRIFAWPQDTLARRIALATLLAIIFALTLGGLFVEFAGVWGRPSVEEMGRLELADDIVRMVEAASERDRRAMVDAVSLHASMVNWYPVTSREAAVLQAAARDGTAPGLGAWFQSGGHQRTLVHFDSDSPLSRGFLYSGASYPDAHFLAVELKDSSWVVFTATRRDWGLEQPVQIAIALMFLVVSILAASAVAAYYLSLPIRQFTEGLHRFGTDPRAPPIPEVGPLELCAAIRAFNAMQTQLQKFVEDRTAMLAAISHDLRTPLTKIRLRGEFIEDEDQRARLFRDVEELRAMADSALAFFRDDYKDEETTAFDFPELLRTIADDYSDQGTPVAYTGPDRAVFRGRPFALKRACTNLVDNAVKYGATPEMELRCSERGFILVVSDRGPGIPTDALEEVFTPFYRLERSRNRATGGTGLGLTSARAVIRGHGGDIAIGNRPGGGLEVRVTLPIIPPAAGAALKLVQTGG